MRDDKEDFRKHRQNPDRRRVRIHSACKMCSSHKSACRVGAYIWHFTLEGGTGGLSLRKGVIAMAPELEDLKIVMGLA